MLTIQPLTNAVEANHYYHHEDNYYINDKESLTKASNWYGKGAQALGLSKEVSPLAFLSLLSGQLPTGKQLGIIDEKGERQHRPGTDITLSPPKSVSILALIGEDERLLQAHDKAVKTTLDTIESIASEARVSINGKTSFEKTNNLVVARFCHTTSRELDAQLHDHCIILNMTKRTDGEWRALSSRSKFDKTHLDNGFREILYNNQHYFGLIYNGTLAKEACDIGYDIEIKDKYGNFEIKGVPKAFIENQSKRREQILTRLNEKGLSSASAAEIANLDTRRAKQSIDMPILIDFWKNEAEKNNIDLNQIIHASKNKEKGSLSTNTLIISQSAKEAINDAISHLSVYQTKIKHIDLIRMAYEFSTGTIHHLELEKEIEQRFKNKELLGEHLEYYTTDKLLIQEKNFIKECKKGIEASFSKEINQSGITATILRQRNRIQLIDVNGLTNEKNLIEELVHQSEATGCNAYVLHVGRLQTNRLSDTVSRNNGGIWNAFKNLFKPNLVQTVTGFSNYYNKKYEHSCNKNDVFIVHDAQKLSYDNICIMTSHFTGSLITNFVYNKCLSIFLMIF